MHRWKLRSDFREAVTSMQPLPPRIWRRATWNQLLFFINTKGGHSSSSPSNLMAAVGVEKLVDFFFKKKCSKIVLQLMAIYCKLGVVCKTETLWHVPHFSRILSAARDIDSRCSAQSCHPCFHVLVRLGFSSTLHFCTLSQSSLIFLFHSPDLLHLPCGSVSERKYTVRFPRMRSLGTLGRQTLLSQVYELKNLRRLPRPQRPLKIFIQESFQRQAGPRTCMTGKISDYTIGRALSSPPVSFRSEKIQRVVDKLITLLKKVLLSKSVVVCRFM